MLGAINAAAQAGCYVIVEGMLTIPKYLPMIESLVTSYGSRALLLYFDVTLEEVLQRHASRSKSAYIPSSDIEKWYTLASAMGCAQEIVMTNENLHVTTQRILELLGLPMKMNN